MRAILFKARRSPTDGNRTSMLAIASPRRPLAALCAVLAVAALTCMPARAQARDSDAPPGASDTWLPNEAWVGEHWMPYDERDLYRVLEIDPAGLIEWLSGERKNLSDLARSRGMTPRAAVDAIMRPQRDRLPASRYRLLRSRAMRTFTQTHLSVHLFFHPLHDDSFQRALPSILGVGYPEMGDLRAQGLSLYQIAARHGKDRRRVDAMTLRALRAGMRRGVRRGEISRAEARAYLAYQRSAITGVMEYVAPRAVAASAAGAPGGFVRFFCVL
jgi:hypothetical protein